MDNKLLPYLATAAAVASGLGLIYYLRRKPTRRVDGFVFSGPSGVGKGTLLTRLLAEHSGKVQMTVSHTTRAIRAGEKEGVHYHFVPRETMEAMISRGEFLESCDVHGNLYGTSRQTFEDCKRSGCTPILEIDVKGAQKVRQVAEKAGMSLKFVYITATEDELEQRIRGRGSDDEATIKKRLDTARSEAEFLSKNPNFFAKVLYNKDLEATYNELKDFLRSFNVI